jgi:hypothetical protein
VSVRDWVTAEYAKAQLAARDAAGGRGLTGNSQAPFHVSAVARMVALGQVLERLDEQPVRMQTEPGA